MNQRCNICRLNKNCFLLDGMFAFVKVNQCPGIKPLTTIPSGKTVRFYMAAEDLNTCSTPNGILARAGQLTKERAE